MSLTIIDLIEYDGFINAYFVHFKLKDYYCSYYGFDKNISISCFNIQDNYKSQTNRIINFTENQTLVRIMAIKDELSILVIIMN